MDYEYIGRINYEEEITTDSVFPEWINTDRVNFRRFCEDTVPPQQLKHIRETEDKYYQYFLADVDYRDDYDSVIDTYEKNTSLWEAGTQASYAMFEPPGTDDYIGNAYIEAVDFKTDRCELGIWLREDYRGQGYAQARAEALFIVCFEHLDVEIVEFQVVVDNQPSISSVGKMMQRFGGSFDGRRRNATVTPMGETVDVCYWSISRDEFHGDATYTDTTSVDSVL